MGIRFPARGSPYPPVGETKYKLACAITFIPGYIIRCDLPLPVCLVNRST